VKQNHLTVTVETPDHIELQFQLAGIGKRFLAYLVDRLIQFGLIFALFLVISLVLLAGNKVVAVADIIYEMRQVLGQWIIAIAILVYGVVSLGYFILFEYIWSGSTPGKRSQHIRVIRTDGAPISFLEAAVRNILRAVDILADIYPLGLVVMFIDSRNRRLGDMAAGTLVVTESVSRLPSAKNSARSLSDDDQQLRLVAAAMSSGDYQLVRKFLARREGFDAEYRQELVQEIVDRIFNKSTVMVKPSNDPELLLERVEAVYRERLRIL
jgi:uncharacterized RDD family membrane protein YckC